MNIALEVWPLEQRVKSRIRIAENGCWEWTACLRSGYGVISWNDNGKKKIAYAHRIMWEAKYGKIPDGMFILHKCDNKKCINPDHLFIGTQADNIADSIIKGRQWWQVRRV